ncbi:MAG: superoxide dismutase family protein [Lachnospiraceae bacterium]|nr:superoxide dismutase family protein [Lachnospiraceae bacterium]
MNRPSRRDHSVAYLFSILSGGPQASARIAGSGEFAGISGAVRFYQTNKGVIVFAEIGGLPKADLPCQERVFGFHIHEGNDCEGNGGDPFADAMSHYNPQDCEHPHHAGDLPPLFGNDGFALSLFLTDRFSLDEVTGRTVIIHDGPDDFTTQPSGNSGTKIACGVIQKTERF